MMVAIIECGFCVENRPMPPVGCFHAACLAPPVPRPALGLSLPTLLFALKFIFMPLHRTGSPPRGSRLDELPLHHRKHPQHDKQATW